MPQSKQPIGTQYIRSQIAKERNRPFSEAEDLSLLKSLLTSNTPTDSTILENRMLTNEDKKWQSSKLDIDQAFQPFENFLTEGVPGGGTKLRENLTIQEIEKAEKLLPDVTNAVFSESNTNPRTSNYINSLTVTLSESMKRAKQGAILNGNLETITKQVEDLGDPIDKGYIHDRHGRYMPLKRGEYNISKSAKFISDNIKTQINNANSVGADDIADAFAELNKMLADKQFVTEELNYFSKNPEFKIKLESSEDGTMKLNQAIRLMQTEGNEDIGKIKGLIEEIPGIVGNDFEAAKKTAITSDKTDKENERNLIDSRLNVYVQAQNLQLQGEDDLHEDFRDGLTQFNLIDFPKGDLGKLEVQKEYLPVVKAQFMQMLSGVEDFNEPTSLDQGYASDFDLKDEIEAGNIDRVVGYFLDSTKEGVTKEDRNRGIKTIGEARLDRVKSGNDTQTANAIVRLRTTLKQLQILQPIVSQASGEPILKNDEQSSLENLLKLGIPYAK